jgi:hypothetical protein
MVVDPGGVGGQVGWSAVGHEMVVEEKFDVIGCPLDRIEVEGAVDVFAGGEREFC